MQQYLYILSNPSMPGLIKIGKTTTSPNQRMSELHSTGVPTAFALELSVEVDDCQASEQAAHSTLSKFRVANNREFFRISVAEALKAIIPVIGRYKIHEVQSSHGIESIERELNNKRLQAAMLAEEQQQAREKRKNELEMAIAAEQQKLHQLSPRPIKKVLPFIGDALSFAYMPPYGWVVRVYILVMALIFFSSSKHETAGLVCIVLLIAGFIAEKTDKGHEAEFDRLNLPFILINNRIDKLQSEIRKL